MKILVVNWKDRQHPHAGGAEVYTWQVARRWVAAGHDVVWLTSRPDGLPERERDHGIKVVRTGTRFGVYAAARRWWMVEGRHAGFDVIVDEVNTRPFFCHRWPGAPPTVALIHQTAEEIFAAEFPAPVAAVGRRMERRWLRRMAGQKIVTVSPSTARSLQPFGIHDALVLPQGTDPRRVPDDLPTTDGPTVAWIARLAEVKQPLHVLEAFARVRDRVPTARLWLMGDGPLRDDVEQAAAAVDGVEVLGRVSDLERDQRLAAADVLAVTSIREGWCLTVSEAALLGTPTVGYDVSGVEDSVPASGGLLVDPKPAALADGLVAVLTGAVELTATPSTVPFDALADRWLDVLADATAPVG